MYVGDYTCTVNENAVTDYSFYNNYDYVPQCMFHDFDVSMV